MKIHLLQKRKCGRKDRHLRQHHRGLEYTLQQSWHCCPPLLLLSLSMVFLSRQQKMLAGSLKCRLGGLADRALELAIETCGGSPPRACLRTRGPPRAVFSVSLEGRVRVDITRARVGPFLIGVSTYSSIRRWTSIVLAFDECVVLAWLSHLIPHSVWI